jgi:hypothetical protein
MISKKQGQLSKNIWKTKRNSRWIRGRRGLSHHSSEIILRDSQILEKPEMIETGGQRPRKPPIRCLGCKGDHMFIDCPHRGEKVRIFHNVHQAETMEDMGRNVRRIYASLDNKRRVPVTYD